MALSANFVDAHISRWEAYLRRQHRAYREKWPSRLFHHAPIENAVKILQDGNLRSRLDPQSKRTRDVAAAGVIDNRADAHQYARLYFRPKTPTQYHIEGIRKTNECSYGEATHAPVLIMFVFDAKAVLSREGIMFCDQNMQKDEASPGDTEEYFSSIPFEKVYHEGGIGGDYSIISHRCAEVLAPSPLPLEEALQWIYCRSIAEKETLLEMLGADAEIWSKKIIISNDVLVFERKFVFVDEVTLSPERILFRFNSRADRAPVDVQVSVKDAKGTQLIKFRNSAMNPSPDPPATRWRLDCKFPNGTYWVEIRLEGHLAYRAHVTLGDDLF